MKVWGPFLGFGDNYGTKIKQISITCSLNTGEFHTINGDVWTVEIVWIWNRCFSYLVEMHHTWVVAAYSTQVLCFVASSVKFSNVMLFLTQTVGAFLSFLRYND
jgi:hypothetical protein